MKTDVLRVVPITVLIGVVVIGLSLTAQAVGTGARERQLEKADEATRLYNEGVKLARAGDYESAREMFENANETRADDPETLNMLAFTQRKTGRLDAAFANYHRALELRPEFPQAREYLGEAHIQAALEQIDILRGYGPEGVDELASLTAALNEAAAHVGDESTPVPSPGAEKW